ncbi:MAG: calcium/sodium antiporter [Planctomycetota bacterium]|jgi:cation:H+ antiporter
MEILSSILLFLLGLAILYVGAEGTIHGAVGIARRIGISSLLIGLTLIAYGTSAPELAIDITAAVGGKTDLAFGDLLGSNIANLGLILGVAVIIRPIQLHAEIVRFEIPLLIIQSVLVWFLCMDGSLSRSDGVILILSFGVISCWTIYRGIREKQSYQEQVVALTESVEAEDPWKDVLATDRGSESQLLDRVRGPEKSLPRNGALVLLGLFGLIAGAQLMVYGAVGVARLLGVSELTIGLTIVAVGTSLPELATSILASRRQESDIVIGNVAGSNLFNIGCILGLVACITPFEVPEQSLHWDLPLLIGFSALLLPIAFAGAEIRRWVGWVYLAGFAIFICMQAMHN